MEGDVATASCIVWKSSTNVLQYSKKNHLLAGVLWQRVAHQLVEQVNTSGGKGKIIALDLCMGAP